MLDNKKAVIFDLDGTIVDSMWIWTTVDEEYMAKYHLAMPPHFHEQMEGMSYTETAQYFIDSFPSLNKTIDEVKNEWHEMVYEKYAHEVQLKAGVYNFITDIRERGLKCGIATSNGRALVDTVLYELKINHLFDAVRTSCEVSAGKPAPDVYLKVAEDLQVRPEHCLVFEDVPMGILAGRNAGMTVCGVDDSFSRHQEERKKSLADYYIYNYDDIRRKTYEVL